MYRKILVPLDGSEVAECALPHVEAILSGCNVVDVVLLRVIGPLPLPGDHVISEGDRVRLESKHRTEAQSYLEKVSKQLNEKGIRVRMDILDGQAAEEIVDYARNNDFDLIIMATHGRTGIGRWALGSVADKVVRRASAPVLMVQASKS